jgi:NitT/TauT family transport system ATP-binding protein
MGALLEVKDLTLRYLSGPKTITATHRVSFSVAEGDRLVILGASGCGKSTLLKAIGGYVSPAEGAILLDGKKINGPGRERIMMFQEFDQLLPWKTVQDNVVFALVMSGKARGREAQEKAKAAIRSVKLERFAASYPHTLSGGMKQRVALARAFALEPRILLMDEPFAALDEMTRTEMQQELLHLWQGTGMTLVFVTHSIKEALAVGSRVLLLSAHPGQVRANLAATTNSEATIHELLFGPGSKT